MSHLHLVPPPDAPPPAPPGRRPRRWLLPRAVLPPLWRELATPPPARSRPPHAPATGRGEPVLLIPGFLAGDSSLGVLASYLEAAGHAPFPSGIAANIACSEATLGPLERRVEALAERHGRRVALVGHSRGGVLGRALASRRPELVSGVVTLGSPLTDHLAVHPLVWAHALGLAILGSLGLPKVLRLSCAAGACCTRFWDDLHGRLPAGVGSLAVFTRTDGVVDWRACLDPFGPVLEAVGTTHCGLVTHPPTLHAVAVALAGFAEAPDRGDALALAA